MTHVNIVEMQPVRGLKPVIRQLLIVLWGQTQRLVSYLLIHFCKHIVKLLALYSEQ